MLTSSPLLKRRQYLCHPLSVPLANAAIVYSLSCVLYLLLTRRIGTPFMDSLSKEQRKIKAESSSVRKEIFLKSLLASSVIVCLVHPFSKG